jgi:Ca2+-transporting ATPase
MAAPHLLEESHEKEYAVLLGAPDVLLKKSKIKKEEYLTLLAHVEKASNEGKRVVGVALMPIKKGSTDTSFNTADAFSGALFLGTLLFYDPVRKSVPEALAKMNAYGARIVIATGDLKGTALAVARSIGWNVDEGEVLTGDELEKLSDSELLTYLSHIKVFARVTPEDKLRIGKLFQQMGEVVGMTGDGVNDSPALKAMDIGIALGGGSDVAKSVADLVLLDNDFNTIVSAIEEGRRMLHNIRKTFIYLMSNCLDEVILIGGSLLLGLSLPLSALQIIWVNFFTGSLPAIAFAFDDDGDLQVHEKTRQNGRQSIINDQVKFLTLGIGILTSVLLFALYVLLVKLKVPTDISKTFLFACFASYILFVAFSFRSLRKPLFSYSFFGNRMLTFGVLLGIASLFATLYVPSLQKLFNTVYLPPVWILLLFVWILVNITLVEGAKWLFYRKQ